MAQIDNIVQVFISRQTVQIDITSFSIPLLLVGMDAAITAFATDRVKTYTSLDEVADDFPVTHHAYIMASKLLSGDSKPATFKIAKQNLEVGSEETVVAALQATIDVDDTWYIVMSDSHVKADILALAASIQAMRKMYFTSSNDADGPTQAVTTDVGSMLKAALYDRTSLMYSLTADTEFPECAWVGSQIIEVPGSNTWEYKRLLGVTVSVLSGTAISVLEAKGYNYYITVKGVPITRRGKTSGSSWIDEIILVDWIYARIQEQIFFRLINTKKIPFTDAGATMIENEIRSVLTQGQNNGGIDTYTVTSPRVLSIPEMQRAAREFGDFKFQARLAGAASIVTVRGVVTA